MNLTQTAQFTRRAIAATVFLIIALIVGRVGWKMGYAVYRHFVPPKSPPPEVRFGKIPQPQITSLRTKGEKIEYILDTPTGKLPQTPRQLPVSPMEKIDETPLSSQRAQRLAEDLGLSGPPKVLAPNTYEWGTGTKTLEMNIVSQNFSLTSNLHLLEAKLIPGTAPAEGNAQTEAQTFLSRLNLSDKLLETGEKETLFLKLNKGNLEKAESISEAQLTRVDFFKTVTVGERIYKILGSKPKEGHIHLLISKRGRDASEQFPVVHYQNWKIKESEGSTYPLLSIEAAWKKFENGESLTTYLKPQGSNPYQESETPELKKIRVQKIYLSYYESETPPSYLSPVFVFEGLAETSQGELWDFVSYLPAVSEEWLETSEEPKE